jgi:hypothetical protein
MYGNRLTRDFGESVPEPWKQAIGTLTRYQVDRGLRRLTAGGSGSVPTLPQFMKACRMVGEDDGPSAPTGQPVLPAPEIDKFTLSANRWMLNYLMRKGAHVQCLPAMIDAKNRLAAQYREIDTEDPVKDEEFLAALHKAWNLVWISNEKQDAAA